VKGSNFDAVCGMRVGSDSAHSVTYEGQRYMFRSAGCRAKFAADPAKYATTHREDHDGQVVAPARNPDTEGSAGTIYTCPMRPQVRQIGPGNCPICGMALEPEMPAEQEDEREIRAGRSGDLPVKSPASVSAARMARRSS
jgi:P-type Cu+ transporter